MDDDVAVEQHPITAPPAFTTQGCATIGRLHSFFDSVDDRSDLPIVLR